MSDEDEPHCASLAQAFTALRSDAWRTFYFLGSNFVEKAAAGTVSR